MDRKEKQITELDYSTVDWFKLVFCYFVVGIHSKLYLVTELPLLDKLFQIAVPYYFIASGFFLFRKIKLPMDESGYERIKNRIKKLFRIYLMWTAVYLPLSIYGELREGGTVLTAILKILRGVLFVGENFYSWQLWYLLGAIVASVMIYILLRGGGSANRIFWLSLAVFLGGYMLDYINRSPIYGLGRDIISLYYRIFVSTRNGIFVGFACMSIGMRIALHGFRIRSNTCAILSCLNFLMLCLVPSELVNRCATLLCAALLFVFSIQFKGKHSFLHQRLAREVSVRIYFVHMIVIAIYRVFYMRLQDPFNYFQCFCFAALNSTAIALLCVICERRFQTKILKMLFDF